MCYHEIHNGLVFSTKHCDQLNRMLSVGLKKWSMSVYCHLNVGIVHHKLKWLLILLNCEVESRTQGSRPRPRPRTQRKSEAKAKDSLSEDRPSRGQGQECSRPRPRTKDTSASALQKKIKKKVFAKIFQAISKEKKKGLHKHFSSDLQEKTFSKKFFKRSTKFNNSNNSAVLEPRTGQFSWTWGQGQGLDLRGQSQGLQNVSSRTPPLIASSKPKLRRSENTIFVNKTHHSFCYNFFKDFRKNRK